MTNERPDLDEAFGIAPTAVAERPDLDEAFGVAPKTAAASERPDLDEAFGIAPAPVAAPTPAAPVTARPTFAADMKREDEQRVKTTPTTTKPRRSYASELATALQGSSLYGSATTAAEGAADKGITRKSSGEWDLPIMAQLKPTDGWLGSAVNTIGGATTTVAQKLGARIDEAGPGIDQQAVQEVFYKFQKDNNLSDEEVQSAWNDFGRINRTWAEDEKLRVLSNGAIFPNQNSSDWLDPAKAEALISKAPTSDEAKGVMREKLAEIQTAIAANKLESYEAAAEAVNSVLGPGGMAASAGTLGLPSAVAGRVTSPSEWAKEQGRNDLGTPEFMKAYETEVVDKAPWIRQKIQGLAGKSLTGQMQLANTVLGMGGIAGSETLGRMAGEGSEASATISRGLPDTGMVGSVVEQGPSLIAQMVPGQAIASLGLKMLAAAGTFGMAGAQSAGMNYADLIAQGVDPAVAREKSIKTGVATAVITSMFGTGGAGGVESAIAGKQIGEVTMRDLLVIAKEKGVRDFALSPEFRGFVGSTLKAAGGEYSEERIDQFTQAFLMADPDTNLADAWATSAEAGEVGLFMGGGVHLAMSAMPYAPESARAAMEPGTDTEAPPTAPEKEDQSGPEWITPQRLERSARARLDELRRKRDGVEAVTTPDGFKLPAEIGQMLDWKERETLNALEKHLEGEGDVDLQALAKDFGRKLKTPTQVKSKPAPTAVEPSATSADTTPGAEPFTDENGWAFVEKEDGSDHQKFFESDDKATAAMVSSAGVFFKTEGEWAQSTRENAQDNLARINKGIPVRGTPLSPEASQKVEDHLQKLLAYREYQLKNSSLPSSPEQPTSSGDSVVIDSATGETPLPPTEMAPQRPSEKAMTDSLAPPINETGLLNEETDPAAANGETPTDREGALPASADPAVLPPANTDTGTGADDQLAVARTEDLIPEAWTEHQGESYSDFLDNVKAGKYSKDTVIQELQDKGKKSKKDAEKEYAALTHPKRGNPPATLSPDEYAQSEFTGSSIYNRGGYDDEVAKDDHRYLVEEAVEAKEPIATSNVDTYGITLPEGYVKRGDLYVYEPTPTTQTPAAQPAQEDVPAGVPEAGVQPTPSGPAVAGSEAPDFAVDDKLVMHSPHSGEDAEVSFRGFHNGGAIVWTGRTQMQVPLGWLRKQGEPYVETPESKFVSKYEFLNDEQPVAPEPAEAPMPTTKAGLIAEYAGPKPTSGYKYEQEHAKLVKQLQKFTVPELRDRVKDQRERATKDAKRAELTKSNLEPIKTRVESAGTKWRAELKTIASENGDENFSSMMDNPMGGEIYRLASRLADRGVSLQPTNPPSTETAPAEAGPAKRAVIAQREAMARGVPYSIQALADAFDLTDEQAVAADAISRALGAQIDLVAKGGVPGSGALSQENQSRALRLLGPNATLYHHNRGDGDLTKGTTRRLYMVARPDHPRYTDIWGEEKVVIAPGQIRGSLQVDAEDAAASLGYVGDGQLDKLVDYLWENHRAKFQAKLDKSGFAYDEDSFYAGDVVDGLDDGDSSYRLFTGFEEAILDAAEKGIIDPKNLAYYADQGIKPASTDTARFNELTKDLDPQDIEGWKASHPEELKELTAMRERVLRGAGYDVKGWHGTAYQFTVPLGHRGVAMHVALNQKMAEDFAKAQAENVRDIIEREGDQQPGESTEPIVLAVLGRNNLFDPRLEKHRDALIASLGDKGLNIGGEEIKNADYDVFESKDILDAIKLLGFDGYYESESGNGVITSYAVFNPADVKSLEPLNTDADGRLIPPSAWGDTGNPSILYQSGAKDVARHSELEAKFNAGTITPEETAEAEKIVEEWAAAENFERDTYIHETTSEEAFTEFKIGGPKLRPGQELTGSDIWGDKKLSGHAIWFRTEDGPPATAHHKGKKRPIRVKLKLRMPLMEDRAGIDEYGGFGKDFPHVVQPSDVRRLKELGKDSVVYLGKDRRIKEILIFDPSQIKSAEPFTGVPLDQRFDSSNPSILQQDAKASFEITETGKILLRGLQNPDFTSAVHEISHASWLMVESLERQYAEADAAGTPLELDLSRKEIKELRQWSTLRDKQWEKGGGEDWSKSKIEGKDRYAKEKWARGWERYFREGKAPQARLQAIFDKIAGWMAEVYKTIAGSPIDVEISPEVRAIMDKLAGRMEQTLPGEKPSQEILDDVEHVWELSREDYNRLFRGRIDNMNGEPFWPYDLPTTEENTGKWMDLVKENQDILRRALPDSRAVLDNKTPFYDLIIGGKPDEQSPAQTTPETPVSEQEAARSPADTVDDLSDETLESVKNDNGFGEMTNDEFREEWKRQLREVENPPPAISPTPNPEIPDFTDALEEDSVTGLYHAQTDADRARMGLPPRFTQPVTTDQEAWDRATAAEDAHRAAGLPGTAGTDLLTNLLENPPRVLDKNEHALLLHEKLVREQAVEKTQQRLNALPASTPNGERKNYQAAVQAAQEAFDLLVTYADAAGSRAGLSLQARKMLIYMDFTLAAVVNRLKAAKNMKSDKPTTWTDKDQKAAVEIAEKLQQAQERIEALEAGNDEQTVLIEQLTKDVERAQTKLENRMRASRARTLVNEKLNPLVEAAKARMAARKGTAPPEPQQGNLAVFGPTPEMLEDIKDITIIASGWIANKALTLEEFSRKLTAEFGDWLAEHAQRIFRGARSLYIETAESVTEGNSPTPETVIASIDGTEPLNKADVWKLARAHVVAGKRGRNVLDAVFGDLLQVFPTITREEVSNAFTGYGTVVYPSDKEVPKELRRIRTLEREYAKQFDIAAGRIPKRTGYQGDVKKGPEWAEVRAEQQKTSDKLRELENQMREAGIPVPSDDAKLANALNTAMKRLTNEIEEIELAIASNTARTPKTRTPLAANAEVDALKKKLKEKRAEYDEKFKDETARERRILGSLKKRTAELERRIAEKDFSKNLVKPPVNTEAKRKADFEFAKVRAKYDEMRHQYLLANAPTATKAAHYFFGASNLLKMMVLGTDVGVIMRQLGTTFQAITRDLGMLAPTKEGAKKRANGSYVKQIITEGIKAFGSDEYAHRAYQELMERTNAGWDKSSGLVLNAPFDVRANSKEDIPPADVMKNLPWWLWPALAGVKVSLLGASFPVSAALLALGTVAKPLTQALDRAQRTMTNQSRAMFFDEAINALHDGHPTVAEAKAIAKAVMVGTGRGTATQKIEAGIPLMNQVFLATRYYISRIQAASLYPLWNKDARTSSAARKEIAKMYGRSVSGRAVMYGLAALAFGKALTGDDDDPEEGLIVDPRNPKFMSLKLAEGVSIDYSSSINQYISLAARLSTKTRVDPKTGHVTALGSGFTNNAVDEATKFLNTKLSLPLGFTKSIYSGAFYGGKPATTANILDEMTTAIIINDTYNVFNTLMEEHGPVEGAAKATVYMSMMFGGAGASVYSSEAEKEANAMAKKEAEAARKEREANLNE